jgi:hypothetical protein
MDRLEDASEDNWEKVKSETRKTYESAESSIKKVAEDIEEWFE